MHQNHSFCLQIVHNYRQYLQITMTDDNNKEQNQPDLDGLKGLYTKTDEYVVKKESGIKLRTVVLSLDPNDKPPRPAGAQNGNQQ